MSELGIADESIAYEFFGKSLSLPELAAEQRRSELQSTVTAKLISANAPSALANLVHLTNPDAWAAVEPLRPADRSNVATTTPAKSNPVAPDQTEVVFAKSEVSANWADSTESLLELAEQTGLSPAFSCRSGICSTCVCAISEIEVEYFEQPLDTPKAGHVLICCSRPIGRVVLEL